jgi:hypothetical protein
MLRQGSLGYALASGIVPCSDWDLAVSVKQKEVELLSMSSMCLSMVKPSAIRLGSLASASLTVQQVQ